VPTYEYRCRACAHGFDIVQSFKDETLTICPACGGELRKVFAAPAISFKGSGFYANDSRKAAEKGSESGSREQKGSKDAKDRAASKDGEGSKDRGASKEGAGEGGGSKPAEKKKESGSSNMKKDPPPS
jgi:putative FmdB family regulatory protein